MKFTFVNPRDYSEEIPLRMPQGLLTLASISEARGHIVGVLDMNALRQEFSHQQAFKKDVCETDWDNTDAIVVTCNFGQYPDVKWILPMLKKYRPECLLIVAGGVPSALMEKSFTYLSDADLMLVGEPEDTWVFVMSRVDSRRFNDVMGVVYRDFDKQVKKTSPRPLIEHLDQLPLPAYHLLEGKPMAYYLQTRQMILPILRGGVDETAFYGGYSRSDLVKMWSKEEVQNLDATTHQRNIRYYGAERFVDEVTLLRSRYGIPSFSIYNTDFMHDVKQVEDFCNTYMRSGLHDYLKWACVANGYADTTLLRRMHEAGCVFITLNLTSNSPKILKSLGYEATSFTNQMTVDTMLKSNIPFNILFRMGFAVEDLDDVLGNIVFCRRNNFRFEPVLVNLQLGSEQFPRNTCLELEEEKIFDKYMCEYGVKPLFYGSSQVFSDVELLGLWQLARSMDVERILQFAHDTGRAHDGKYAGDCPVCRVKDDGGEEAEAN